MPQHSGVPAEPAKHPLPTYFPGAVINGVTLVNAALSGQGVFRCRCGKTFSSTIDVVSAQPRCSCGCR